MKVSIVIPYYNSSKYHERLLLSISDYLNNSDYEIIFIDDFSKEVESKALIDFIESCNAFNLFYLRNKKNLGASKSRNLGVNIAKGKYIAFLDADDAWAIGKLKFQLEIMEKNSFVITGCRTEVVTFNEFIENSYNINRSLGVNAFYNVNFSNFLFKNYFSIPSVMVLRSVILANQFSDKLRYSEDYECWRRILINNRGAIIPDLGVFSFKHSFASSEGLSSNLLKMSFSELIGLVWILKNPNVLFRYKLLIPFACIFSIFKSFRRFFISQLSLLK